MEPWLQPLLQYGVLGVVAIGLFFFSRDSIKRERDAKDRAEAEVIRLNNVIQDKTIPLVTAATNAIVQVTSLLQSLQYQRDVEAAARVAKEKKE